MKQRLRTLAGRGDEFMHRLGWSPRWLCELADLSYGCPIDSFGRPELPREERMACRTARVLWRLIGNEGAEDWELIYDKHGWFYLVDIHGEKVGKSHNREELEDLKAKLEAADDVELGIIHIPAKNTQGR